MVVQDNGHGVPGHDVLQSHGALRGPATGSQVAESQVAESQARSQVMELTTSDGVRLRCRCDRYPGQARAQVVVVHGFSAGADDPDVRSLVDDLLAAQMDAVTYDARGHGLSEGRCAVGSTEHLDVACVISHVISSDIPTVVVGVSMGAVAVVAHLAQATADDDRLAGAVLVSSPSRWRMRPSAVGLLTALMTRTATGRWAAARWMGVRISSTWGPGETPESAIGRIRIPVAIVHGLGDKLLSPVHARRLGASGPGFWEGHLRLVEGMKHGLDQPGRTAVLDAVQWVLSARVVTPTTTTVR